jgi:hypothetical protein
MFKYGLLRTVLALITFLTACGRLLPASSGSQPLPSPGQEWAIKLTQSGGIAGVHKTVEVSSDGQLKAEDQRSGSSISQTLPPEATAELIGLLSKASVVTAAAPHSGCADCFIYDLEVTSGGKSTAIRADDTTLDASGAAELIAFLQQLRDRALKSAP